MEQVQYENAEDINYSEHVMAHFGRSDDQNRPVAFAVLMEPIELSNSTTSEIKSVFTIPRNRNQGLMEGLLRKIEEYAEGEDIDELRIGTHPENEPMRKLAEKLDYELESLGEEYGARYVKQIR